LGNKKKNVGKKGEPKEGRGTDPEIAATDETQKSSKFQHEKGTRRAIYYKVDPLILGDKNGGVGLGGNG